MLFYMYVVLIVLLWCMCPYKVLQKDEWERLALVESMDFVKLTYKSVTWVVKLKWENGKLYFGRMWNAFAKAGNMRKGDTIAFQKTEKAQKYMICIFERDLCSKCNYAGKFSHSGICLLKCVMY